MCVRRREIFFMLNVIIYRCLQEPNNEKTNNGIHYKLQLLYSNGKLSFPSFFEGPCAAEKVLLFFFFLRPFGKGYKDFEIKITRV